VAELGIDKLPTYLEIPAIQKDSMAGDGPFKASPEIQEQLGFPVEKVENWQQIAIDQDLDIRKKLFLNCFFY